MSAANRSECISHAGTLAFLEQQVKSVSVSSFVENPAGQEATINGRMLCRDAAEMGVVEMPWPAGGDVEKQGVLRLRSSGDSLRSG